MNNKDDSYTLVGMIELGEDYFTVASSELEQYKDLRGRGTAGKHMAESDSLEDIQTRKIERQSRCFKTKALSTHNITEINLTIEKSINEKSIILTDKSTSYVDIYGLIERHVTKKARKETTKETLKWVHITISNAKRNLLSNYHKMKGKYLHLYLSGFVYKLNQKYFRDRLFDRLVIDNIVGL